MSEPFDPYEERPRRRDSWSLKSIVEEVGGRPLSDYQDPDRPQHPYVRLKGSAPLSPALAPVAHLGGRPPSRGAAATEAVEEPDPVARVYPPLTGATGRRLHGPENEHHMETLATVRSSSEAPEPGQRPHPPGPSKRPERIYLHYLLLHIDRLSDHALRYLDRAVREELEHRESSEAAPPAPPS